jgi:hypothetical protein
MRIPIGYLSPRNGNEKEMSSTLICLSSLFFSYEFGFKIVKAPFSMQSTFKILAYMVVHCNTTYSIFDLFITWGIQQRIVFLICLSLEVFCAWLKILHFWINLYYFLRPYCRRPGSAVPPRVCAPAPQISHRHRAAGNLARWPPPPLLPLRPQISPTRSTTSSPTLSLSSTFSTAAAHL